MRAITIQLGDLSGCGKWQPRIVEIRKGTMNPLAHVSGFFLSPNLSSPSPCHPPLLHPTLSPLSLFSPSSYPCSTSLHHDCFTLLVASRRIVKEALLPESLPHTIALVVRSFPFSSPRLATIRNGFIRCLSRRRAPLGCGVYGFGESRRH